jgi:hypothetical protein
LWPMPRSRVWNGSVLDARTLAGGSSQDRMLAHHEQGSRAV